MSLMDQAYFFIMSRGGEVSRYSDQGKSRGNGSPPAQALPNDVEVQVAETQNVENVVRMQNAVFI
jgi:hypothetical protein